MCLYCGRVEDQLVENDDARRLDGASSRIETTLEGFQRLTKVYRAAQWACWFDRNWLSESGWPVTEAVLVRCPTIEPLPADATRAENPQRPTE